MSANVPFPLCSDTAVSAMWRTMAFSWGIQVRQLSGSTHPCSNAYICMEWYIWQWFLSPKRRRFEQHIHFSHVWQSGSTDLSKRYSQSSTANFGCNSRSYSVNIFLFIWWQIGRQDAARPAVTPMMPSCPFHPPGHYGKVLQRGAIVDPTAWQE